MKPPQPPQLKRKLAFYNTQKIGIPLLMLLPILAVAGIFGSEVASTVFRVIIIYLFVLIGLRIMGKREFSELSPLEFVSLMMIPEIVSEALNQSNTTVINGMVGVATLLCITFINSLIVYRFKTFEKVMQGQPVVLAHNGQVIEEHLHKEHVTIEEIYEELHHQGVETIEETKWVILDADGKIAVIPKEQ